MWSSMRLVRVFHLLVAVMVVGTFTGCANYEINTKRGNIPGMYIRYELQEADRAIEAARSAGKEQSCPAEFKAAEAAKNNAYDVFRACHTEEGAALAKKATALANALCPPQKVVAVPPPPPPAPAPVVVPPPPPVKVVVPHKLCSPSNLDVKFDTDKADIKPAYHGQLKVVGDFLKEFPNAKGTINGYTDNIGTKSYNQKLSQRRADSVRNYIIKHFAIDAGRISTQAFGLTKPVADNKTKEGRAKNRRIEANFNCK